MPRLQSKAHDTKIFENHLNTVMLVFIGVLSDEYLCAKVSVIFSVFLHFFISQINYQQHKG